MRVVILTFAVAMMAFLLVSAAPFSRNIPADVSSKEANLGKNMPNHRMPAPVREESGLFAHLELNTGMEGADPEHPGIDEPEDD
ncbi:hypothetical protein BGZ58_008468 [Dissophora ornata]|nr:hypothetical protein BGZ58_008468 [Dissophora ornata]